MYQSSDTETLCSSDTETLCSFPAGEDLFRETLADELQKLQLENIELKSKYKAVKNELQNYHTLNHELESENRRLASNEKDLRRKNEARINELNQLLNWYKASSQSRIKQLESEIAKYQLKLRTEVTNNPLQLNGEITKHLIGAFNELETKNKKEYRKHLEKETTLVRQYNRLVKCK